MEDTSIRFSLCAYVCEHPFKSSQNALGSLLVLHRDAYRAFFRLSAMGVLHLCKKHMNCSCGNLQMYIVLYKIQRFFVSSPRHYSCDQLEHLKCFFKKMVGFWIWVKTQIQGGLWILIRVKTQIHFQSIF